jgi:hypothetical protein
MTVNDLDWKTDDPELLKTQLGQLVNDMRHELAELAHIPMQLLTAGGTTTTGKLEMKFGFAHSVSVPSAAGVTAILPRWTPEVNSTFSGIVRQSATGTVTVSATGKINGAKSITLPAVVGLHLFWCDGSNHWTVET